MRLSPNNAALAPTPGRVRDGSSRAAARRNDSNPHGPTRAHGNPPVPLHPQPLELISGLPPELELESSVVGSRVAPSDSPLPALPVSPGLVAPESTPTPELEDALPPSVVSSSPPSVVSPPVVSEGSGSTGTGSQAAASYTGAQVPSTGTSR